MNKGWKRLTIVLAVIWAIGCGFLAFIWAEGEERSIIRYSKFITGNLKGIGYLELPRGQGRVKTEVPLTEEETRLKRADEQKKVDAEINFLYLVRFPFMWAVFTICGYFVVATIFFTIRWVFRGFKAG